MFAHQVLHRVSRYLGRAIATLSRKRIAAIIAAIAAVGILLLGIADRPTVRAAIPARLNLTTPQPLVAQVPDLGLSELARPFLETYDAGLEADWVLLDGRRVITIAAPRASTDEATSSDTPAPVKLRVTEIERQLKAIARQLLGNNEPIQASVVPQDGGGLVRIEVNGNYLMSVTIWDAQVAGVSLEDRAQQVTQGVTAALERFRQERSPQSLTRQAGVAAIVAGLAIAIAWGLQRLRQWLKSYNDRLLAQFAPPVAIPRAAQEPEEAWRESSDPEIEAEYAAATQEWHERKDRLQIQQDLQEFLLQLLQVFVWPAGAVAIFGLFPHTRYIQTEILVWFSGPAIQILAIAIFTYLLLRFSFIGINRLFTALSRGRWVSSPTSTRLLKRITTFSEILKSVVVMTLVGGAFLLSLAVLNVNVAPILAGVGIVGLAVSFGAQNLVRDIINGFLILLEDQFSVGDVISTNGVTGFVEDVTLRVTRLRSGDGNLIVIPNGSISMVENLTNGFSRANLVVEVAYETNLDFAIATIAETAERMAVDPEWQELIVKPPQVLGVDSFGENSIAIRVWIDTQPLKQWSVAREFRLRLKEALDRAGISIPFPQRSIWFNSPLQTIDKSLSESELQQLLQQRENGSTSTES